jgi:predicted RNase H-like nuclease (RuvC/YqgF family)
MTISEMNKQERRDFFLRATDRVKDVTGKSFKKMAAEMNRIYNRMDHRRMIDIRSNRKNKVHPTAKECQALETLYLDYIREILYPEEGMSPLEIKVESMEETIARLEKEKADQAEELRRILSENKDLKKDKRILELQLKLKNNESKN